MTHDVEKSGTVAAGSPQKADVCMEDVQAMDLWKATQAVRLGELRLSAQASALAGAQTRGTTILGWVVASIALAASLAFNSRFHLAGYLLLVGESTAGLVAAIAVFPIKWAETGAQPQRILEMEYDTELECQQSLALYYHAAIKRNAYRLSVISKLVSASWLILLSTPIIAWLFQLILAKATP
jgi:hypothetical protein